MPIPIPRPPTTPPATAPTLTTGSYILTIPTKLNRRLVRATHATRESKATIILNALETHLDQRALAEADHPLDGAWPWHHLTITHQTGPLQAPVDDGRGLRCPPICRRLPAWAYCWARHDEQRTYWPRQPGEYRIRPGGYTPATDGKPAVVEWLEIQTRDTHNDKWAPYDEPDPDPAAGTVYVKVTAADHRGGDLR